MKLASWLAKNKKSTLTKLSGAWLLKRPLVLVMMEIFTLIQNGQTLRKNLENLYKGSYKCQTYRNSHLFGKSVSPCIFLILIYTDQEHTGTHTFSKCAGKVSDLKRCEFLYVLATHVIWSGTYKNLHLFKILWKQSYQFRCESLYVPCLYI